MESRAEPAVVPAIPFSFVRAPAAVPYAGGRRRATRVLNAIGNKPRMLRVMLYIGARGCSSVSAINACETQAGC
jgi:hypothetical protein